MENTQPTPPSSRRKLALAVLATLVLAVPLTVTFSMQNQDNRQRASSGENRNDDDRERNIQFAASQSASTKLFFTPSSSASSPATFKTGDTVAFDVMIDPGKNRPTIVTLGMEFDPLSLQASGSSSFVPNIRSFPVTVEGPLVTATSVSAIVSVGANPDNAIRSTTKVGTLYLKAKAPTTANAAKITFTSNSKVLSIASTDRVDQNVLSNTTHAFVAINQPIPTPTKSASPSAIASTSAKVSTSPSPTASSSTMLSFNILLNGIGNVGDKSNRKSKGNQNPKTIQRTIRVELYDSKNERVARLEPQLTYSHTSGSFVGQANVNDIPSGVYRLSIKADKYLSKSDGTTVTITKGQTTQVTNVSLTNGDVNDDNRIDIRDFNQIQGCFSGLAPAKDCDDKRKQQADLNDDGEVNEFDYNLYMREISVQEGD